MATTRLEHSSAKEFAAYVLMDFATAEKEMEDRPLVWALSVATKWGLADVFKRVAMHELHLKPRQWKLVEKEADALDKAES